MKKVIGLFSLLAICTIVAALCIPASPATAEQARGNGNGDCVGDLNDDGFVDVLDLMLVFGDWMCQGECDGDVNGDGIVNVIDVLLLFQNWGPCDESDACLTNADCDDGDPCTFNFCVGGACVSAPNPLPNCGNGR